MHTFAHSQEKISVNGIGYRVYPSELTATVTGSSFENGGDIIIPEIITYGGQSYTVTGIQGEANSTVAQMEGYYAAFKNSTKLTSIALPKTIKYIGKNAFSGCTSLKAVYITDLESWCNIDYSNLGLYYEESNPLYYAHDLYLNNEKVSDLVFTDNITTINNCSFVGGSFKSVTFGKEFKTIGEYSFSNCDNLKDVYCYSANIPCEPVESYFQKPSEKTLHIRERYKDNYFNMYQAWDKFGTIEYIEGIDYHLKYVVDDLEYKYVWYEVGETITPEAIPTKEGYKFSGWSEIPSTMPNHDVTITGTFTINKYRITYKVDGADYKTYDVEYNSAITPEEAPTKKGMTFSGWSAIPEKMPAKDIEVTGTFSWSTTTKDNIIYQVNDATNNTCSVIGYDNAGEEIKIASSVDFDDSYKVSTIKAMAFKKKSDLKKVELPATVTKIEERAFADLDKLADVTIWAENVPETDRTAFENSYIEDYVTLHVPASAMEKYQAAAPWKNFKEIVALSAEEDQSNEAIKISGAGQTTYCCDYDLDFKDVEGIKAYTATGYDRISGTIWLTRVFQVPAGEGILIIGNEGEYKVPRKTTGTYYSNLMVGTPTAVTINETEGSYTNYYLSNGTYGVGFYKVNGTQAISAHRAYLPLLKGTTQAGTRFIGVSFGDDEGTTGINGAIQSEKKSDDAWYTIQGQRVNSPRKGLYIRNGKKVLIK